MRVCLAWFILAWLIRVLCTDFLNFLLGVSNPFGLFTMNGDNNILSDLK